MTNRQWQEVFSIVRREQKSLLALFDEDRYNELTDILDQLYPLAYPSQSTTELDAWSFE